MANDELRNPSRDTLQKLRQLRESLCQGFDDKLPQPQQPSTQNIGHDIYHELDDSRNSGIENHYQGRYEYHSSSPHQPHPSGSHSINSYTDDQHQQYKQSAPSRRPQHDPQTARTDQQRLLRPPEFAKERIEIQALDVPKRVKPTHQRPPVVQSRQKTVHFDRKSISSAETENHGRKVSDTTALRNVLVEEDNDDESSTVCSGNSQREYAVSDEESEEEEGSADTDSASGDLEDFTLDLGIGRHNREVVSGSAKTAKPPPRASAALAVSVVEDVIEGESGEGGSLMSYQGPVGHIPTPTLTNPAADGLEYKPMAVGEPLKSVTVEVPPHDIQLKTALPSPTIDLEGSRKAEVSISSTEFRSAPEESSSFVLSPPDVSDASEKQVFRQHTAARTHVDGPHNVGILDETWRRERWLRPFVHGHPDVLSTHSTPPRQGRSPHRHDAFDDNTIRLNKQPQHEPQRVDEYKVFLPPEHRGSGDVDELNVGLSTRTKSPPLNPPTSYRAHASARPPIAPSSASFGDVQKKNLASRSNISAPVPRNGGGGVSLDLSGMTFESLRDLTTP